MSDDAISRRGFLKGGAVFSLGMAGLDSFLPLAGFIQPGVIQSAPDASPAGPQNYTRQSAALEPDQVVASACQFCNSLCRLQVALKQGRILEVRGEPDDPVQAGEICIKGQLMAELVYNRFRLRQPLKRVAGEKGSPDSRFEPITWDEAYDLMARRFLTLRDAGLAHTIANRTSGRLPRGTGSLIHRFFRLLGSPNDTDVGPVCNDAGGNALSWTFGLGLFTNGYGVDGATGKEDLGSARFLLFLGTNQAETHPVTFSYLLRARQKTRARLVVIDPRRTPTAALADEWLAIKPHSDLALILAMLHEIVTRQLYDKPFVRRWVLGFEELRQHLIRHDYTPQWAAQVTGLPADAIRDLAHRYATTRPAAIFCNAGISHQLNAFATYRALTFLAAITGNIGVPGGGCNFMHNTWPGDLQLPPPVGEAPSPSAPALPVGPDYFAQAILTGQPYPLRAVVTAGNPLMSSANSHKVREAFRQLEFYVYTGLFMEESAYYADLVLPVCSGFEMETVYMRRDDRAIRWQAQVVPRVGMSKPDWEIWIELAQVMARQDSRQAELWKANFPLEWRDYRKLWATFVKYTPGMGGLTQERLQASKTPLRFPCPTPQHPGVSTLYLDHPGWYQAVAALNPQAQGKRFLTPSGKVEIFTPALDARLAGAGHAARPVFYTHPDVAGPGAPTLAYTDEFVPNPVNPQAVTRKVKLGVPAEKTTPDAFPLTGIIGRASVVHFAGVTQWTYTGKRLNGIRYIQIHPKAAAAGLRNGDAVAVESPRGRLTGTVLLWEGIREDVIFIPNSFGEAQLVGDEVDTPRYAPANILVDDAQYDNLSGQQAYKCFACRIGKVT